MTYRVTGKCSTFKKELISFWVCLWHFVYKFTGQWLVLTGKIFYKLATMKMAGCASCRISKIKHYRRARQLLAKEQYRLDEKFVSRQVLTALVRCRRSSFTLQYSVLVVCATNSTPTEKNSPLAQHKFYVAINVLRKAFIILIFDVKRQDLSLLRRV